MKGNWIYLIILFVSLFRAGEGFADDYADALRELGIPAAKVEEILVKERRHSAAKLGKLVEWLGEQGLTRTQIATLLPKHPNLIGLSIGDNLTRKVNWLKKQGVPAERISHIIRKFGDIFSLGIDENLEPKVSWLRAYGVSRAGVAIILSTRPDFLNYNFETDSIFLDKVNWFRSLGATPKRIANIMVRGSQVFGYSLEVNLKPTWKMLREEFGLTLIDIEESPMLLGASLDRLAPLLAWAKEKNINLKELPIGKRKQLINSCRVKGPINNLDTLLAWADETYGVGVVSEEQILSLLAGSGELYRLFVTKGYLMKARHWQNCIDSLEAGLAELVPQE